MEEIVISKKELAARGFAPCKLNGTYTVQINTQKTTRSGWVAFNCTAVAADNSSTDCTIGASVLMAVASPLWEEDKENDEVVFFVGASAVLTFAYTEGEFSASILAAEAPVAPVAPAPAPAPATSRRGRK